MGQHLIDVHTADRLVSGVIAPEDAPPGFAAVAGLLQAARTPSTPRELARCAQTVTAMAGTLAAAAPVPSAQTGQRAGLSRLLRPRIAATLMAGALVLSFYGLAEADVLPGALQHAAHVIFGKIGLSVPDSGSSGASTPSGPLATTPGGTQTGPRTHGHRGHGGGAGGRHHGNGTPGHHGTSAPTGAPKHHHAEGTGSSSSGSTSASDRGLCNAWSRGHGGQHGKRMSSTAFRRLAARAEAQGKTVEEYCAGSSHHTNGDGDGSDGNGKQGHKHGHKRGHHGSDGEGDGGGQGGDHGSGEGERSEHGGTSGQGPGDGYGDRSPLDSAATASGDEAP